MRWCLTGLDRFRAVGKDGTEVLGWPMRVPDYDDCIDEGRKHQGWVTFDLPRGFMLDHFRYENYPPDYLVIRP